MDIWEIIKFATPYCVLISGAFWGLIRYIANLHKKTFEEHKMKCEDFQRAQEEENKNNALFRHKYDGIDKTVVKLVGDVEKNLSDKIGTLNENVNIILQHILNKK